MQILMMIFNSTADGKTAINDIDTARANREIGLHDLALVFHDEQGRIRLEQTTDATAAKGLVAGGTLGLLVGVLSPLAWVAATAVGGAAGAIVAGVSDAGIDNDMMKALGTQLENDDSMVLALGVPEQIEILIEGLEPHMENVEVMLVPSETQDLIRELAKLNDSERFVV